MQFHVADIVSVILDRPVRMRGATGVHGILSFMTGHQLLPFQLPRARDACAPALLAQFPQLADVESRSERGRESLVEFLLDFLELHGEYPSVEPLAAGSHQPLDADGEALAIERLVPFQVIR